MLNWNEPSMNANNTVGLIGGTGTEGRGIVLRLAQAGVPVMIGSRSAEKAAELAGELNAQLGGNLIQGTDNAGLLEGCRVLFLTVPFEHAASLLGSLSESFRPHHILVDVTVPLYFQQGPRLLELPGSGSEHLRKFVPPQVAMTATFKTLPAHLLCELEKPLDCDEFIVSDSDQARDAVLEILEKIPTLRWIDAGPLRYAKALEGMTLLAVGLNRRYKSREGRFRMSGI